MFMLTPQDIADKGFDKVVFNGYDMGDVDEFLEAVSTDFNALYKENAILKGKLKVLVEKVEEYRSTEDAMRMALLTAQRMGEEITVEANRTKDELIKNTENEIKEKLTDTAQRIAEEEMRLAVAAKETSKFIELSQAIMRKHAEFLEKLETARRTVAPKGAPKQAAVQQSAPAKVQKAAKPPQPPPPPPPKVMPVEHTTPPAPVDDQEVLIDDIALQIGSVVEQLSDDETDDVQAHEDVYEEDESLPSLFEDDDGSVKLYATDDINEETSPRPKFDFDDLKFGANFDSDD